MDIAFDDLARRVSLHEIWYKTNGDYGEQLVLRDCDLAGVNLSYKILSRVILTDVDLTNAVLYSTQFQCAELDGTKFTNSILRGANMSFASAKGCNFEKADVRSLSIAGCDLDGAVLTPYKHDLFLLLMCVRQYVAALRDAIVSGRINGQSYKTDEFDCACVVGTLSHAAFRLAQDQDTVDMLHKMQDIARPIEWFALDVQPCDTPETSWRSRQLLEWVDEFMSLVNLQELSQRA